MWPFGNKVQLMVGQVWTYKKVNPFEERWFYRIDGVKDGYVLYHVFTKSMDAPFTHSTTEKCFRSNYNILAAEDNGIKIPDPETPSENLLCIK